MYPLTVPLCVCVCVYPFHLAKLVAHRQPRDGAWVFMSLLLCTHGPLAACIIATETKHHEFGTSWAKLMTSGEGVHTVFAKLGVCCAYVVDKFYNLRTKYCSKSSVHSIWHLLTTYGLTC